MATFDLRQYARRGAEARVAELNAELDEIYRAFPDLRRRSGGARSTRGGRGVAEEAAESAPRRRRSTMSPAQRKAVSARMKRYWAERRKAAGK